MRVSCTFPPWYKRNVSFQYTSNSEAPSDQGCADSHYPSSAPPQSGRGNGCELFNIKGLRRLFQSEISYHPFSSRYWIFVCFGSPRNSSTKEPPCGSGAGIPSRDPPVFRGRAGETHVCPASTGRPASGYRHQDGRFHIRKRAVHDYSSLDKRRGDQYWPSPGDHPDPAFVDRTAAMHVQFDLCKPLIVSATALRHSSFPSTI